MRVLLDTHTLIWALSDDPRLSSTARDIIIPGPNQVLVSVVSAIEIAIKASLGKLKFPGSLSLAVQKTGFEPETFCFESATRLQALPWHHRDPFDRMLIAQAQHLKAPIISRDAAFSSYDVQVIW